MSKKKKSKNSGGAYSPKNQTITGKTESRGVRRNSLVAKIIVIAISVLMVITFSSAIIMMAAGQ